MLIVSSTAILKEYCLSLGESEVMGGAEKWEEQRDHAGCVH